MRSGRRSTPDACEPPSSPRRRSSPLRATLSSVAWRSGRQRSTPRRSRRFDSSPARSVWRSLPHRLGAPVPGTRLVDVRGRSLRLCHPVLLRIRTADRRHRCPDSLRHRAGHDDGGALAEGERASCPAMGLLALAIAASSTSSFPAFASPSPLGAGLMATAAVAWAVYSIRDAAPGPIGSECRQLRSHDSDDAPGQPGCAEVPAPRDKRCDAGYRVGAVTSGLGYGVVRGAAA